MTAMHNGYDLHDAAAAGSLAEVKRLVESGMNTTSFDDIDWTPLHHAARNGRYDVVRYLLSTGVDVNIQNYDSAGETPLGASILDCSYRMAKLLIDAGADPRLPGWAGIDAIERVRQRRDEQATPLLILLARTAGWLDRDEECCRPAPR